MSFVYYNDHDPFACAWLRELIGARELPEGEVDGRSVLEVGAGELRSFRQCHFFAGIGGWAHALRLAGFPEDREIWTASLPCQPLSVAGQGRGDADERHLWPAFHRLVAKRRPATIVGEQVASLDGREWFAGVRADLEELGYACGAAVMPACAVGAPHRRERLWWCAMADADEQRCEEHAQRDGESQRSAERASCGRDAAGCGDGGMADAESGRGWLSDESGEAGELCQPGGISPRASGQRIVAVGASDGGVADAGQLSEGRAAGRGETQGWRPSGDVAGSGDERVGDADEPRSQGRAVLSERAGEQASGAGSVGGGMVDASGERRREGRPEHELRGGRDAAAGAGFWDDAEWRIGADGKARRVKSGVRLLVDGFQSCMDSVFSIQKIAWMEIIRYAEICEADPDKILRMVREGICAQACREEQSTGMCGEFSPTQILLNFLLDIEATRDGAADRRGSKKAQREIIDRTLRSVRFNGGIMHSSRKWASDGQLAVKPPTSLPELSFVLARHADAHWQAAFYAHAASNRVGALRGFGNAIVPQVAAIFLEAVMGLV